ncbi:MAG: HD domain-containing protein [Lachnospiraceae bacterium]|nr:HD domain-containing protein [Lachnospiraceae bacterium]
MDRKNNNMTALLLCAAGILLNIILNTVVTAIGVPLYLDTVGTVAVAVMGGYLPGIFVGFVTNLIKSISDPTSMYYGVLNVIIAVFATYFSDHGLFKKKECIPVIIVVFTLIGGGIGSLIPLYMQELAYDSESLSSMLYETGYFNAELAHILSSIIMNLPDKAITVFLVFVILRLVPVKYYDRFSFKNWKQAPVPEHRAFARDKTDIREHSLQTKTLFILIVSLSTVATIGTIISMSVYHKTIVKERTNLAIGTARIAASVIDADHIDRYLKNGGNGTDYRDTKRQLQEILYSSSEIEFLYVYKVEEDGCHVVFDIDTADVAAEAVGTVLPFEQGIREHKDEMIAGKEVTPVITNDKYGHLLTACQPVYDSRGKCACYVMADVDMAQISADERSFLMEMITVFSGFIILLGTFVIWLAEYHIIFPIKAVTKCVNSFVYSESAQERIDADVKMIRSLDVKTGDEVEEMYNSIARMMLDQAEQMRSIRRLSESTAKMQDGLIVTMADLVENRDSDTGAHIQKTAAYVNIIVEGLKKKGYYAEKITPKFITDVVRSAPLHDVGKINIPDEILNKPGKLTPEEFEIMKTHTVAGKKIMENAISTVKGDNYLKEARNMAAYHHERWDGKGYPEGLHGEVIPLAARIMAVADVFDALTSRRVYKPAFPLEKALAIIEEGKGTQFDPKCVEALMDSLEEVKLILKKYNRDE